MLGIDLGKNLCSLAGLSLPNVWPAPDLQVNFCELVSISLQ